MVLERTEAQLLEALRPAVKLDGQKLAPDVLGALVTCRVERGVGMTGRAQLRFKDTERRLTESRSFTIGQKVTISAKGKGDGTLFTGHVTSVEFELDQSRGPGHGLYSVTLDDDPAKLAWSTDTATFVEQSAGQIIQAIAEKAGITATVTGLPSSQETYFLQRGTALAAIDELARRAGAVWWTDGEGRLVVMDASAEPAAVKLDSREVVSLSVRVNSRSPDMVEVTGWDSAGQREVKATERVALPSFVTSAKKEMGPADSWANKAAVADLHPADGAGAQTLAKGLAREASAEALTMTATLAFPGLLEPGSRVSIEGIGTLLSGPYPVSRVEHDFGPDGFTTRLTAGSLHPLGLADLVAQSGPHHESMGAGVVPAVVTDVNSPDKNGRVKVKFPSLGPGVESAWARVVTLGAGNERGMVFHPEVEDEVLVAFEDGDRNRPVVLGGLHSEKKKFPWAQVVKQGKVTTRRLKSRLGHTLEFGDGEKPTEKHIKLSLADKEENVIRLGEDKLEIKVKNLPVLITNGQASIEFADNGDITLSGNNVTIKAKANIKVEATADAAIKATANLKAEAMVVSVKGQGQATFEASGQTAVKGAVVMIN